jgi:hypothetical protein
VTLMGREFWGGQLEWLKKVACNRFNNLSPEDLDLVFLTDEPAEAVRYIGEHLSPRDREPAGEFHKWDTPEGKVMP